MPLGFGFGELPPEDDDGVGVEDAGEPSVMSNANEASNWTEEGDLPTPLPGGCQSVVYGALSSTGLSARMKSDKEVREKKAKEKKAGHRRLSSSSSGPGRG